MSNRLCSDGAQGPMGEPEHKPPQTRPVTWCVRRPQELRVPAGSFSPTLPTSWCFATAGCIITFLFPTGVQWPGGTPVLGSSSPGTCSQFQRLPAQGLMRPTSPGRSEAQENEERRPRFPGNMVDVTRPHLYRACCQCQDISPFRGQGSVIWRR